ncbi:outer membrane lipoprotein-sorting protein [Cycloclasticus sp. 44_32_T64]|nr:outer membrane lipoprotein-sorting protein [Cycloclasticus sp. 44_32_T64]
MKKLVLMMLCLLPLMAVAQTSEEKGLEIAVEADKRDMGFGDVSSSLTMTLKNANGDTSIRKMRSKTLEVQGDGDKGLTIFDKPADVKGTAFLSFTHVLEADDQWLYLPALKRVKRISSKNKSGPFMGSEFAFEDLSSREVEKYKYLYLNDDAVGGEDAFVIEVRPNYKYSGYTRSVVWISKTTYQPLKINYYDRKNSLLKTMMATGYKQYLGKYWRPDEMNMVNHQTKKETLLEFSDYKFQTGLKSRDFSKASLKRAR